MSRMNSIYINIKRSKYVLHRMLVCTVCYGCKPTKTFFSIGEETRQTTIMTIKALKCRKQSNNVQADRLCVH